MKLCVQNPAATYFVRLQGDSIINVELTVKLLETKPKIRLVPMNREDAPIDLAENAEQEVFGVAAKVIHRFCVSHEACLLPSAGRFVGCASEGVS